MNLYTNQTVNIEPETERGSTWTVEPSYHLSNEALGSTVKYGSYGITFTPSGTEGFLQIRMEGQLDGNDVTAVYDITIIHTDKSAVKLKKVT